MKSGKSNLIGIWLPVDRPIVSYMRFLQISSELLGMAGYEMLITGLSGSMAYSGTGRAPHTWPVDGLIAHDAGKAVQVFRADPQNDSVPIVVIGLEDFANADNVSWDLAAAAEQVTKQMIDSGSRHIVHVTLDWIVRDYPREQRRRGYTKAMVDAGLKPVIIETTEESVHGARAAMTDYLNHNDAPDGLFGFTDTVAVGASSALLAKGLRIPDDCAVWGYGNFPEGESFMVPISSLSIPIRAVATQAWDWLCDRMEDITLERRERILPMDIIERSSTRRQNP